MVEGGIDRFSLSGFQPMSTGKTYKIHEHPSTKQLALDDYFPCLSTLQLYVLVLSMHILFCELLTHCFNGDIAGGRGHSSL
jgi:hypothetical protein